MQGEMYCVILAGGKGERLWPLSRAHKPKQLLPLFNEESLLEHTISRIENIVNSSHLWVVTTDLHAQTIESLCKKNISNIIIEPATKNTAPAILLTCLELYQKNPDAVVAFLPADHWVEQTPLFQQALLTAAQASRISKKITLLGLKPSYPAVGYGYIECGQKNSDAAHSVTKFHEKPSLEVAQSYLANKNMLWNIGIFCAPVATFLNAYKTHAPLLYNHLIDFFDHKDYDSVSSISFDHAILEHSDSIDVVPVSFTWSDVGNLETFLMLKKMPQPLLAIESHNNIVHVPRKLVALIGIENICVVETDDVLLITQRKDIEKVKTAVHQLKLKNYENYL